MRIEVNRNVSVKERKPMKFENNDLRRHKTEKNPRNLASIAGNTHWPKKKSLGFPGRGKFIETIASRTYMES